MLKISALSFVFLILFDLHYAFESGAPEDVCVDMKPKHLNAKPQLPPSPYKVVVSVNGLENVNKAKLEVSIEGSEVFKGFLLQCRNAQGLPIGEFDSHPNGKLLNCSPGKKNAVTHLNASEKYSLVFKWSPPKGFVGKATCVATVVKSAPIFWTQLKSEQIDVV